MSQHVIDAQLSGARWRALNSSVVLMHNGPLTKLQTWSAAVFCADGLSALAGRTAAEAAGLVGWETDPVHILIPRGSKVRPLDGVQVKVHESRRFLPTDVHASRTPAQVTIERAVIDAAAWSTSARTACGLVTAAVQQRLTTAARLRECLDSAGQIRHRRLLSSVLTDIGGGAQAVSELDFVTYCRRHRLPTPRMQVRVDARGRRRYLDAELTGRGGRVVTVEIDGAVHLVASTYWRDMERQNDIVLGGRTILRYPSYVIYADDPIALAQLRAALGLPQLSEPYPLIAG